MNDKDKELLAGCFKGEIRAREAFVIRFSNLVYTTIQQAFKAQQVPYIRQDLEDLHNTIFVRLLERHCRRLRQYKGKNGCSLPSWIRMISVRTVIDYLRCRSDALSRTSKLDAIEDLKELADERTEQWTILDRAEKMRFIEKGMEVLLPRDQLFIRLHCFKGLSMKEIAGILKVSENNAYLIKHRAIKRLKTILNPYLKPN
jgi:RNA polymerase sigma-70 factor, ECF subfamily